MLQEIVDRYLQRYPAEKVNLEVLLGQIAVAEKLNDRRNFNGHITGSGIILSPDKTKVLMVYHQLFKRWLQPGGHWESDDEASPLETAQRECQEETAVQIAASLPIDVAHPLVPLNIDTHQVPAQSKRNEPTHWHHDFAYLFVASSETLYHDPSEVNIKDARWFKLDAPETESIQRPLQKLAQLSN